MQNLPKYYMDLSKMMSEDSAKNLFVSPIRFYEILRFLEAGGERCETGSDSAHSGSGKRDWRSFADLCYLVNESLVLQKVLCIEA